MEPWRASFRDCWAPTLSDAELLALTDALAANDARLVQGKTVDPLAGPYGHFNAMQACGVAAAAWLSRGPMLSCTVHDMWKEKHREAERRGATTGSNSWRFLAFWDDEPWDLVRAGCLSECSRELARRGVGAVEDGAIDLDAIERLVG